MGDLQKRERNYRETITAGLILCSMLLFLTSCNSPVNSSIGLASTNFYCSTKPSTIVECVDISSSRCYYLDESGVRRYKTCTGGTWLKVEQYKTEVIKSKDYFCYNDGTCRYKGLLTNPLVNERDTI